MNLKSVKIDEKILKILLKIHSDIIGESIDKRTILSADTSLLKQVTFIKDLELTQYREMIKRDDRYHNVKIPYSRNKLELIFGKFQGKGKDNNKESFQQLICNNIIFKSEKHIIGVKSSKYSFNPLLLQRSKRNPIDLTMHVQSKNLIESVNENINFKIKISKEKVAANRIDQDCTHSLRRYSVDVETLMQISKEKFKFIYENLEYSDEEASYRTKELEYSIDRLVGKIGITKVGTNNDRRYHKFTNIPKYLRPCIRIDGNVVTEIDAVASQIGILMSEMEEYEPELLTNDFYTLWSKYARKDNVLRDEVKRLLFRGQLFNKIKGNCIDESKALYRFKEYFPLFVPSLIQYKLECNEHGISLAMGLQRKEASLWIPVCHKFDCIGIHDSVLVPEDKVEEVIEYIKSTFKEKLGFDVQLKIKPLTI